MSRRPVSSSAPGRSSTFWVRCRARPMARRQFVGVFAPEWVRPMAEVLGRLGGERAWVVHGDGLDELTTTGPTTVASLDSGKVETFEITAADAGLPPARLEDLRGGEPTLNARLMQDLLAGARRTVARCRAVEQCCGAAGRRPRRESLRGRRARRAMRSIRERRAACSTISSRARTRPQRSRRPPDERRARPHLRREARACRPRQGGGPRSGVGSQP